MASVALAQPTDQTVHESTGTHWFPGRLRTGPTKFANLGACSPTEKFGTLVYCSDCSCGTPCTGGGTGAYAMCLGSQGWNCPVGCGPAITATTTTTTTTTTSTTLLNATNFFLWLPSRQLFSQLSGVGTNYPTTINQLRCHAWVPTLGINNANTLKFYIEAETGGGAGSKCGVAIYRDSDGGRIVSTGNVDCSTAGSLVGVTSVSFSLVAGTKYQVCTCSNKSAAPQYSASLPGASGANETLNLANAFSVPLVTVASHACTNGAPPLATGTLTADTTAGIPNIIMGTATP